MDKPHIHRRHLFKATTIVAWALLGLIAPWTQVTGLAKNPDTIAIGVTPVSNAPPAAIADLLASTSLGGTGQIALSWTAPQGNAGGVPINNQTVASYTVQFATYSVASLANDTTAWWTATAASAVTLQPPGYIPKSPGSLEAFTQTGLTPGVTYYFAIRSTSQGGVLSPIDTAASTGAQAFAVASQTSGQPPQMPTGVLSTSLSNGNQVLLSWHPVTLDITGNPIGIDHYVVHKYTVIGSTAIASFTVPGTATTFTDTNNGTVYFYRICAVSTGGVTSVESDYLDSSLLANRYAIASDDLLTRLVIPHDPTLALLKENNSYGKDLEIVITRQAVDEVGSVLRSYRLTAVDAATGVTIPGFAFPATGSAVQFGISAVIASLHAGAPVNQQTLAISWFNGSFFIPLGNPVLNPGQTLSAQTRNLGLFQLRADAINVNAGFKLSQGSPYPRVITPNGGENRRVFFFVDNPNGNNVTGTIYDVLGYKVRDLYVNSQSPTANSLVWDGRDGNGSVVPSGVYLYKISDGDKTVTGTVVVAR